MNLFLIVYERDVSCDWLFVTSDKDYMQYDDEIRQHIAEHYSIDVTDLDKYIDNYWVNKVSGADGYKVKLVKE